jgi:hypothetical protein
MNMQVGRVETVPEAESRSLRAGRRLYVPTIVIAGLAAWLSYRGWTALAQTGVARSFDAGRYNLAGPVVLGFVLTVCVLEQVFPAQRRSLLARGHLLDFCYAVFYALLVIPLVVIPVEQAGPRPRLARTMLTQLAEPFISSQTETR